MVKRGNPNFSPNVKRIEPRSVPDTPQPPVVSPSPAVTQPVVEKSLKNNGPNPTGDHTPGRTTSRKRTRPDFYAPPPVTEPSSTPRLRGRPPKAPLKPPEHWATPPVKEPSSTPRRRGRPPKAPLKPPEQCAPPPVKETSVTPRRRGRQPKARLTPQLSSQDLERKNAHQEIEARKGDKSPSTPLHNNQVLEIGSLNNISPVPLDIDATFIDTSINKSPGYEIATNVDQNDGVCKGIDPKILQHVSSSLEYIDGSLTTSSNNNLVHLRDAIYKKHGDITQGCSLESDCMKTLVLLGICKVVQDLQGKKLQDLDVSTLDSYCTTVRDAENLNLDVKWLSKRLDEIKEAVRLGDEAKSMVEERKRLLESVEDKKVAIVKRKVELRRLELEIQDIEEQMARDNVMVEQLNRSIGVQKSKLAGFLCSYLIDGYM